MSFFKRAHDIVEAKANRALDKAENPSEMLDLSYEQMLEQITKVRTALVQIAAARKQLELQEDQFSHTVDPSISRPHKPSNWAGTTSPGRRSAVRRPPKNKSTPLSHSTSSRSTSRRR